MTQNSKCSLCGFSSNRKLIHAEDGKCYCVAHFLVLILEEKVNKNAKNR